MDFKKTLPYFKMLGLSAVAGLIVTTVWYFFLWQYFKEHAEDTQTTGAAIAGFLVFSAIIPSIILTKVFEESKAMKNAVDDDNFNAFKKACNSRVHPLIHITIIVISLCAIVSTVMIPFQFFINGAYLVFALTLIHSFLYIAVIELDNPLNGFLISTNIPKEWIEKLKKQ